MDDPPFAESGCPLVVTATLGLLARCLLASTRTHRSGLRSSRLSRPSSLLCPVLTSARRSTRVATRPGAAHAASPRRPPEISHPLFAARPPALRLGALTDEDFAIFRPLVHPSRLSAGSCASARSFAPRCFQTRRRRRTLALRYPSPRSGWDEDFHFADGMTCSAYKKSEAENRFAFYRLIRLFRRWCHRPVEGRIISPSSSNLAPS